jgi:flotillin
MFETLGAAFAIAIGVVIFIIASSRFRIVVPTNDVHVVQHASKTTTYGKDQPGGNVYYHWPAWIPHIGVRVTSLPSSVFPLKLGDYPAYDKGRVPFILDVIGFFRLIDFGEASSRVSDMRNLQDQVDGILKGAMRSILASSEIEEILEGRSQFGERFTTAVDQQLTQWGVTSVKAIELMDIRDAEGSKVIANIMAKKKSLIERESRIAVAENIRAAQVAEIEAQQAVEIRAREQEEMVGRRAAERDQAIGISQQQATQAVQEEAAKTATAQMAVTRVNTVRAAEIARDAQLITADQQRQITVISADAAKQKQVIDAEASKQNTILVAEGFLEQQKKTAEATQLVGDAKGAAETAILMAPVNSQIALAKEIGENQGYQTYLLTLRQIESGQTVGVEAAKALAEADIKIVSTSGTPMQGMKSAMDLVTPAGAAQLGAALETLSQVPAVRQVLARLNGGATTQP